MLPGETEEEHKAGSVNFWGSCKRYKFQETG
jgi:hypothetical protein